MSLPLAMVPRCRSRVKIGEQVVPEWGCGAVLVGGAWVAYGGRVRAMYNPVDGSMCPMCSSLLKVAQERRQIENENATKRRHAQGYGPDPDGRDPYR